MTAPTLADELRAHPFELILSSGFFGFFAHTGVVTALEDAGLRPSLCGGSSAGALVASLWAAGLPAQAIRERLFSLSRKDFWDFDERLGLLGREAGAAPGFGLLRGQSFDALLRESLGRVGVSTFADCPVPVRVTAYELSTKKTRVLSTGDLALAVRASCSFPGMFQPTRIGEARYLDGGIADRPGILAATPGARLLYHHLPARSVWRRFLRAQNQPPSWEGAAMHVLSEPELPRLSPFHLARGPLAFEKALAMARRALASPIAVGSGL